GQWQWAMGNGQWAMGNPQFPIPNPQFPINYGTAIAIKVFSGKKL
ncbi:MAG: hypothetical protein HC785_30885, partial [Calothrix sp. CSU_2_0]|nr:hypothetical protein [Calothrix sp. CSU_2_0]